MSAPERAAGENIISTKQAADAKSIRILFHVKHLNRDSTRVDPGCIGGIPVINERHLLPWICQIQYKYRFTAEKRDKRRVNKMRNYHNI